MYRESMYTYIEYISVCIHMYTDVYYMLVYKFIVIRIHKYIYIYIYIYMLYMRLCHTASCRIKSYSKHMLRTMSLHTIRCKIALHRKVI